MIVKVNDKIFDSRDVPIFLVLSTNEKILISDMAEDNHIFSSYPSPDNIKDHLVRLKNVYQSDYESEWEN